MVKAVASSANPLTTHQMHIEFSCTVEILVVSTAEKWLHVLRSGSSWSSWRFRRFSLEESVHQTIFVPFLLLERRRLSSCRPTARQSHTMRCVWLLLLMVGLVVDWTAAKQDISTCEGSALEAAAGGPADGAQQEVIPVSAELGHKTPARSWLESLILAGESLSF